MTGILLPVRHLPVPARRSAWLVPILALFALLAGCAGRPVGVLVPMAGAEVAGASKVDLLVATTRAPSKDPGVLFSGERGTALSLTDITVSLPPNHVTGQVEWPKTLPADPTREFATLKVEELDARADARSWLKTHLPASRRVLIFVHGFNNRYEDAVYRFAQIAHDSDTKAAPVLFTWPSRASIFGYNYDRESTNYSRDALEEILRGAAADPAVGEVTVLAHSMGTWLTMEALRQMAIRDGRIAPKVKNVILASPDIDVDVFAEQWSSLGPKRPNVTVFVSQDDRALQLSRRVAGDVPRLGQIDPDEEPYRTAFRDAGISVIDLTDLQGDLGGLNHDKFAASPQVVQAIGARLVAGQAITDSELGLGDRIGTVASSAANTLGTAATVAVGAPISIIDPNTRRNYRDQIGAFGSAVGGTVDSLGDATGVRIRRGQRASGSTPIDARPATPETAAAERRKQTASR
ncbi:alpha/beta hydrolase [Mangrovicella endophytica]|uniref:alpha/beta hydrolase n=1 Tax=Mangrovicella endophytica TaxID=2066697 RepID=UPI000C9E7D68|nr:alpha/beta hydrolase [Mangrovicella endophytica]